MKLRWKPFNVEIRCQHLLWLLLLSFQTAAPNIWAATELTGFGRPPSASPQAPASGWVLCCERGVRFEDVCVTDLTFTLTRAPSPAPCPAADVTIYPPHTHIIHTNTHTRNVSVLPLSLSRYLPLFTFLLLAKKQYQTSSSPHWIHTHSDVYKHRPNLTLNANLTSSGRCVGLRKIMCTHRAKSRNCVIAAAHKHVTAPQQGCVQVSETGWVMCLCSSMTSNRLAFLCFPPLAVFIFLSERLIESPAWTVYRLPELSRVPLHPGSEWAHINTWAWM